MSEFASAPVQSDSVATALTVTVNGASVDLLPEGALWWAEASLLVVSDLHLEKASSYAARGQMLPPYDTRATLAVVERLMRRFQPDTVISLGDSFHDRKAQERLDADDIVTIRRLTAKTDWWWVEGNHDPLPPEGLGGRATMRLDLDVLSFQHEPSASPRKGEICGHLHPCAKVTGKAGRSVRTRCFATDGTRLVMPAMGAMTGGLNVCDEVFSGLFPDGLLAAATGRDSVYAVSFARLVPDGARGGARWRL
ncbi:MAG: phosphoesterase [Hirschia sp.]|nr:phosphoesterase [Hirschia sp.]MBF19694.1 phosphoesterase [Hirschia sp.]